MITYQRIALQTKQHIQHKVIGKAWCCFRRQSTDWAVMWKDSVQRVQSVWQSMFSMRKLTLLFIVGGICLLHNAQVFKNSFEAQVISENGQTTSSWTILIAMRKLFHISISQNVMSKPQPVFFKGPMKPFLKSQLHIISG